MFSALLLAVVGTLTTPVDDIAKFEGSWRYESLEVAGKTVDVKEANESPLVIKGKTFAHGEDKGTFTIDDKKTPKTIDLTFTEGRLKETVMKGIYELDDATYKLCVGEPGSDRPKVFDSKAKDGGALAMLKKIKP